MKLTEMLNDVYKVQTYRSDGAIGHVLVMISWGWRRGFLSVLAYDWLRVDMKWKRTTVNENWTRNSLTFVSSTLSFSISNWKVRDSNLLIAQAENTPPFKASSCRLAFARLADATQIHNIPGPKNRFSSCMYINTSSTHLASRRHGSK